jgi:hypothetical protein
VIKAAAVFLSSSSRDDRSPQCRQDKGVPGGRSPRSVASRNGRGHGVANLWHDGAQGYSRGTGREPGNGQLRQWPEGKRRAASALTERAVGVRGITVGMARAGAQQRSCVAPRAIGATFHAAHELFRKAVRCEYGEPGSSSRSILSPFPLVPRPAAKRATAGAKVDIGSGRRPGWKQRG